MGLSTYQLRHYSFFFAWYLADWPLGHWANGPWFPIGPLLRLKPPAGCASRPMPPAGQPRPCHRPRGFFLGRRNGGPFLFPGKTGWDLGEKHGTKTSRRVGTAPIVTPTIDQHGFFGSKNVVATVVKRTFFLTWSFFNQPCVCPKIGHQFWHQYAWRHSEKRFFRARAATLKSLPRLCPGPTT